MTPKEPETFAEQLSRLRQMAAGDDTWDLSDADQAAIAAVLESHAALIEVCRSAFTMWQHSRSQAPEVIARLQSILTKAEGR